MVRCKVQTKKGCFATVLFRTKEAFEFFDSLPRVHLGRRLNVRLKDGWSKERRSVNMKDNIKIPLLRLELLEDFIDGKAQRVDDREVICWDTEGMEDQVLKTDSDLRILIIQFKAKTQTTYRLEFPLTKIRDLSLERDAANPHITVFKFRSETPPLIQRDDVMRGSIGLDEDARLEDLFRTIAAELSTRITVWDIDSTAEAQEPKWMRTVNFTDLHIFGKLMHYRLLMHIDPASSSELQKLCNTFRRFSISLRNLTQHHILSTRVEHVYGGEGSQFWTSLQASRVGFQTIYLIETLVGSLKVNFYSMIRRENSLLQTLLSFSEDDRVDILQSLVIRADIRRIESLELAILQAAKQPLPPALSWIKDDNRLFLIRRVYITPLRVCPQAAELETSNRILRQYSDFKEQFIRVIFVDENFGSVLQARSTDTFEKRIRPMVLQGFKIGGSTYKFLAFSNSQLRSQSCWFFEETSTPGSPTAEEIRQSVGDLSHINIIGKYASRMGQAFSVTTPTSSVGISEHATVADVERNGYCFSDGVGMVKSSFASSIAKSMNCADSTSAYQIRFGGVKGMLTVVPDSFLPLAQVIALRPSMIKFQSPHSILEINGVSKAMVMYLNRQLIALLSCRGVSDEVFLSLYDEMTDYIDAALHSDEAALSLLFRHADIGLDDNSSAAMAPVWSQLNSGSSVTSDAFLHDMIAVLRNHLLVGLKSRARIHVPSGISLYGVMDETAVLQPNEVFFQLSNGRHLFSKEVEAVTGPRQVLVGRNPSLHPGDIRVLKLVSPPPSLAHLYDVLVFPSLGDRPLPNKMSGGDLDGDIYFIIWDERLIPPLACDPMDYASATKYTEPKVVTSIDVQNFFVDYMINDNLGLIADSHVAFADASENGAMSTACIELAKLHSTAVDFPKSGIKAEYPRELYVREFPSFMEKGPRKTSYESKKVLGKIYSRAKSAILADVGRSDIRTILDTRLQVVGYEEYLDEAGSIMLFYYDDIWQLMQQYGIKQEAEILSGYLSPNSKKIISREGSGYDVQSHLNRTIREIKNSYLNEFWEGFEELGDFRFRTLEVTEVYPEEIYKKASAWYMSAYHHTVSVASSAASTTLSSFPLIVYKILSHLRMQQR